MKELEQVIEKWEVACAALDATDNLPAAIKQDLRYDGNKPKYLWRGFNEFEDDGYFSSTVPEGALKDIHMLRRIDEGKKIIRGEREKSPGFIYNDYLEAFVAAEPEILDLAHMYHTIGVEIAEKEDIDLRAAEHYNEEGKKFIEAQFKPEYRQLMRQLIDKMKLVNEVLDINKKV